jgi:hypothetical protein
MSEHDSWPSSFSPRLGPADDELVESRPVDIDELYEPRIVARIDRQIVGNEWSRPRPERTRPVIRKSRLGGAMLAGAMIGLGELVEPEKAKTVVIEFAPEHLDPNHQLVTFVMIPDNPRASRLIIRPWLLDRLRR